MRKWLLIAGILLCAVFVVICGGLFVAYRASQQVPEWYVAKLEADPVKLEDASDELLQQATALASDIKEEGQWQAVFTAEQINGWLAVDLVKNHRDLLPESVSDPRVQIEPGEMTLACKFQRGDVASVLALSVDAYVAEPNVVALRIRKARAGLLPLPLENALEQVSQTASQADLQIQWRQADGDPVALISIPPARDENNKLVQIETIRLGEGEVYLSGSTIRE